MRARSVVAGEPVRVSSRGTEAADTDRTSCGVQALGSSLGEKCRPPHGRAAEACRAQALVCPVNGQWQCLAHLVPRALLPITGLSFMVTK